MSFASFAVAVRVVHYLSLCVVHHRRVNNKQNDDSGGGDDGDDDDDYDYYTTAAVTVAVFAAAAAAAVYSHTRKRTHTQACLLVRVRVSVYTCTYKYYM